MPAIHIQSSKLAFGLLGLVALAGAGVALVLASSTTAEGKLFCNGKPADVTLTGSTTYTGSKNPEVVVGDSASQETHLWNGNDTVCGGGGNDDLHVGHGNDDLFGEGGSDVLRGKPGNDDLDGGPEGQTTTFDAGTERGNGDVCLGGRPRPDIGGSGDTAVDCETVSSAEQQPE